MSKDQFRQVVASLNITVLIAVAMTALMGILIFFAVQSNNAAQSLVKAIGNTHAVTRKMQLYGQLMEYARSRTRLSNAIILEEDAFVQDDINLQLEVYANRYARARLELITLPLSYEEEVILESQNSIVAKILPAQREAVSLAMSGNDASRQKAQQLMDDIIYPGQGTLIDSFLHLMEFETKRQGELAEKGRAESEAWAIQLAWITNLFLFPGFVITAFVIYRVYHNQKEVNDSRQYLETMVEEKTHNLLMSEERLNRSQEIAHVGTWDWDIKNNILYWSDETYRMFGYIPQQFEASYEVFAKHIHKDDIESVNKALQNALENPKEDYHVNHRIILTSGEERFVEELGQVVRNEAGEPFRMIGVVNDITDSMQAEKMKNEFVSIISHELRTPLTAIQGSVKLLLGNVFGKLDEGMINILELANNNCNRLLHLVNDILDLQKMESGKMEYHFEETSVQEFMDEVMSAGKSYADAHDIKLVKRQVDDEKIYADKMRLMQVMNNLISNAVKFSDEGKDVEISATTNENNKVIFAVKDYGRGIPDEHRDKLFERFTQVDSSDEREKLGTGLGLTISKNIVEEHQGHIWYESKLEHGTTFFFELDIAA